MKLPFFFLTVTAAMALPTGSTATLVETNDYGALNLGIPDGNPSGLADVQNVVSQITSIESVTVDLEIAGTHNGDIYAYLTHDTGFTVLLNRSGRTGANGFGYDDDGYKIVLDDAALHNIHTYQNQVVPQPGSPLTGMWQPDGRNVDPDLVLDTDTPTTPLSSFNTLDANGNWTLFVADLSGGDSHTLVGWGMVISGIPEPGTISLVLLGVALLTRRRQ